MPDVSKPARPKLGQHFLRDTPYRGRIAAALPLLPDDLVVEIGAGRGAMTGLLASRARLVVAVEIAAPLAQELQEKFAADSRIAVMRADFLSLDLADLCRKYESPQCFLFGNLPYYITSPIIHHALSFASSLRDMALLMQREVAERLSAAPGSRAYGYLSVLAQLYSHPRVELLVPAGAFSPPPKVQSALVDYRIHTRFPGWPVEKCNRFLQFAKECFAEKRKTLVNNLAGTYSRDRVQQALIDLNRPAKVRGEQLSIEELASLFNRLAP